VRESGAGRADIVEGSVALGAPEHFGGGDDGGELGGGAWSAGVVVEEEAADVGCCGVTAGAFADIAA
jgi:hypothetical protein